MFIVTIVLLVAATGFGLMAWRLWREDRERSKARVASLAAALDGPTADSWSSGPEEFGPEHATRHTPRAPLEQPVAIESMFSTERSTAVQGNPLMKVAIGLAMAVAVIVLIAMTSVRREAPPTPARTQDSTLELLSMSHTRDGETLTVSGLVRNSGDGPAQDITAVVFAFDHNGSFVTSGRARLDDLTLRPGDESPFQVVIPRIKEVGRYRVSFRTEAGLVRHVDRRPQGLRAAN